MIAPLPPTMTPRALAALLMLSLIWGASFLAIRVALDEVPVATSVAWRVGLAALLLWLYCAARGLRPPRAPAVWGALLVMGLLNNVLPFSLMAWGQLTIETGLTSILNAGTAVWGVLAAAVLLPDERLSARRAAGVALGFLGVATAIGLGSLSSLDLRSLAQLAVVAGTVSYALAGVWGRLRLKGLDPRVAAAGMLTGSSLVCVPAALALDGVVVPRQADTWLAILYYAGMATAVAYLLYFRVLATAGAGNLLLCTLLVAPIAILLGAWVRGEVLGPHTYAGFALLAAGLVVIDGRLLPRRRRLPS